MPIPRKSHPVRPANLARRDAILAAAAEVFFEHGYGSATIEQIAISAGVSKVTVYNHFTDKPGLFVAAINRQCAHLQHLLIFENDASESPRDRLLQIGLAMVSFVSRPDVVQFERRIAAETEREPEIGLAFLNAGPRRMIALLAACLVDIAKSGTLHLPDPGLAAEQFAAMCIGFDDVEIRFGASLGQDTTRQRVEAAVAALLMVHKHPSPTEFCHFQ